MIFAWIHGFMDFDEKKKDLEYHQPSAFKPHWVLQL